jgi:hypothetical protein
MLLASLGCSPGHRGPTTVAECRAMLDREVPVGTPCQRVLAYLDEKRIEHSGLTAPSPGTTEGRVIYAAIRDVRSALGVETSLLMEFHCEPNTARLVSSAVRAGHTGP